MGDGPVGSGLGCTRVDYTIIVDAHIGGANAPNCNQGVGNLHGIYFMVSRTIGCGQGTTPNIPTPNAPTDIFLLAIRTFPKTV